MTCHCNDISNIEGYMLFFIFLIKQSFAIGFLQTEIDTLHVTVDSKFSPGSVNQIILVMNLSLHCKYKRVSLLRTWSDTEVCLRDQNILNKKFVITPEKNLYLGDLKTDYNLVPSQNLNLNLTPLRLIISAKYASKSFPITKTKFGAYIKDFLPELYFYILSHPYILEEDPTLKVELIIESEENATINFSNDYKTSSSYYSEPYRKFYSQKKSISWKEFFFEACEKDSEAIKKLPKGSLLCSDYDQWLEIQKKRSPVIQELEDLENTLSFHDLLTWEPSEIHLNDLESLVIYRDNARSIKSAWKKEKQERELKKIEQEFYEAKNTNSSSSTSRDCRGIDISYYPFALKEYYSIYTQFNSANQQCILKIEGPCTDRSFAFFENDKVQFHKYISYQDFSGCPPRGKTELIFNSSNVDQIVIR